ncbi:MAG: FkbM family methyltransferase [Rhizomicrobium sp.]
MRAVDLLWRLTAGSHGTERFANLRYGGFKMRCDLNEMLQRQFYFFGTYFLEDEILSAWEIAAREAKVILDVGANAGIYSLAALASQPNATVHAFEPTPEIAARLRETAKLNDLDRLHVHEVAVSDRAGQAALKRWRGETGSNEGMNFISTDTSDPKAEHVGTVCLDQFCDNNAIDRIDLMKIDIQGNEPLAFAGAARLLRERRIGTVFAELNWYPGRHEEPAVQMIQTLEQAGFQFARPAARLEWRQSGEWMRALNDIVAQSRPR